MNTFNIEVSQGFGPSSSSFNFSVDADTVEEIFNNNGLSGQSSFVRFNRDCVNFQITFDWTCFIEVRDQNNIRIDA